MKKSILLVGLAACVAAPVSAGEPETLTSKQQASVRDAVTGASKDPASARFGKMGAAKTAA